MLVEFNPTLSHKQTEAWDHLENPEVSELMYGGAKYGGKSWFLCVWTYIFACEFAKKYNIPQSDHPLPIGFLGRKVAKNFNDTTMETWYKTIPAGGYEVKGKPAEIIIDKRVKIHTGGLDNRETVNKFNSAEYAFFAIDQAEETTRDDLALLRLATFGRLVVNEQAISGKAIYTANPAVCWLKDEFISRPDPHRRYVRALPTDNRYCTQAYIDNLKDSLRHRPELLRAYLHGDWDVLAGVDQVIQEAWLDMAGHRSSMGWPFVKEYLVCDPARFGDDETVIYAMGNTQITEEVIMPYCRTTEISSRLAVMSRERGDCQVVVESIGADLGAGVIDELVALGVDVITFNPAGKSMWPEKYYNLRAQAWSEAARMLCSGIIEPESNCLVVLENLDDKLRQQLLAPTYKFRHGKVLIESKEDLKARLGQSPDRADTYIIALWAWPYIDIKPEERPTRYRESYVGAGSAMTG